MEYLAGRKVQKRFALFKGIGPSEIKAVLSLPTGVMIKFF
jgi:hypothetical protein